MIQTTAEMARRFVREYNTNKQKELQEKANDNIKAIESKILEVAKQGATSYYFTTSPSLYPLIYNAFKDAGYRIVGHTDSSGTIDWADDTVVAVEA